MNETFHTDFTIIEIQNIIIGGYELGEILFVGSTSIILECFLLPFFTSDLASDIDLEKREVSGEGKTLNIFQRIRSCSITTFRHSFLCVP